HPHPASGPAPLPLHDALPISGARGAPAIRGRRTAMKLFLDTADTALIAELAATGLVDGVTTNPTLIAKSGRPMAEVIAEICHAVDRKSTRLNSSHVKISYAVF